MTTAVIVAMTRKHVDALMPYEQEMFGTEAWSRASYLAELADKRNRYYVAAEGPDGELLGWSGILVIARRVGTGRRMLDVLLAEAVTRGVTEVFLEVRTDNEAARAMYRDAGFDEIGIRRGYYAGGSVDAVTMRKALA